MIITDNFTEKPFTNKLETDNINDIEMAVKEQGNNPVLKKDFCSYKPIRVPPFETDKNTLVSFFCNIKPPDYLGVHFLVFREKSLSSVSFFLEFSLSFCFSLFLF